MKICWRIKWEEPIFELLKWIKLHFTLERVIVGKRNTPFLVNFWQLLKLQFLIAYSDVIASQRPTLVATMPMACKLRRWAAYLQTMRKFQVTNTICECFVEEIGFVATNSEF